MPDSRATPTRSTARGPAPRKLDLFATFAVALTFGAVASQVVLIFWLGSR